MRDQTVREYTEDYPEEIRIQIKKKGKWIKACDFKVPKGFKDNIKVSIKIKEK